MGIDEDVANAYETIKVQLTFPGDNLIVQPIIYEMAQQFDVETNIIQAMVTVNKGWVVLHISGINNEIDKALYWLHSIGVLVDLTLP